MAGVSIHETIKIRGRTVTPLATPSDKGGRENILGSPRRLLSALESLNEEITARSVKRALELSGLLEDDPRIRQLIEYLDGQPLDEPIEQGSLWSCIEASSLSLLSRMLDSRLAVPDFDFFRTKIREIFTSVESLSTGNVATYIPQLARVDPEAWALSVCTVDGQRLSYGCSKQTFSVQSTCKPILYALILDRLGAEKVHSHVGREPSGQGFNQIHLNSKGLPHNPMINAGAIMCASLLDPGANAAQRFDIVLQVYRDLAVGLPVGFDNGVFLSERDTADRNCALAYFMREKGAFEPGVDLRASLDLYFQACAVTLDTEGMSLVAATLANGGVSPLTGRRIFTSETVKNCLSLMASCGMYDFSGEFAFTVGLPAKSGVSGCILLVAPGLCGFAVWSPRLDPLGNSVRGLAFAERLTDLFAFHVYSDLLVDHRKLNPRRRTAEVQLVDSIQVCAAAAKGDLFELRRLISRGVDLDRGDYDGRTALHLAASEGHVEAVTLLLAARADVEVRDRWSRTPLMDAEAEGHEQVAVLLKHYDAPTVGMKEVSPEAVPEVGL